MAQGWLQVQRRPGEIRSCDRIMSLTSDKRDELFENLYASVVQLWWSSRLRMPVAGSSLRDSRDIQVHDATAFLTDLPRSRALALITAGHVVTSLRESQCSDRFVDQIRVKDRGPSAEGTDGVPLSMDRLIMVSTYKSEGDPDYGALVLREFEAITILSGKSAGVVRHSMVAAKDEEFNAHVMLGFPASGKTILESSFSESEGRIRTKVECPLIPVTKMDDSVGGSAGHARFIAEVDIWSEELDDIEGMSGAPVYGLRLADGGLEIRLLAIQSGWLPDKRIIYAEYAEPFLTALDTQVRTSLGQG